jgi:uncharacterized membrane protein
MAVPLHAMNNWNGLTLDRQMIKYRSRQRCGDILCLRLGGCKLSKIDARLISVAGLLSALTVASICLFRVPGPGGNVYFHLGETVMLTSSVLLGRRGGALVGGISSAIADMLLGAALWAPFSLAIHGAECYVVGRLSDGRGGKRDALAMLAGVLLMIFGYMMTAGFLYGAAVMPVEFIGDLMQGSFGCASAFLFAKLLLYRFPHLKSSD